MYWIFRVKRWWMIAIIGIIVSVFTITTDIYRANIRAVQPTPSVALPVVMYHGLHPETAKQGTYVIDPALFQSDLEWLNAHGYTTVTVAEIIAFVTENNPLPQKPILLTFDDGYLNNHLYGTELLKQYGARAVISPICSETVRYSDLNNRNLAYAQVTWTDLQEMGDSGCWEIQNHSYALHTLTGRRGSSRLTGESLNAYTSVLNEDILQAQTLFNEKLGVTPTAFFYPFGAIGEGELSILKDMGFCATFTCTEQINVLTNNTNCLYDLGRFRRPHNMTSTVFFTKHMGIA